MKTKSINLFLSAGLWAAGLPALGQLPVPTGDAEADFPASDPEVYIKADFDGPVPNIMLPATAPPGIVSGWDIKDIRFKFYDLSGGEVALGVALNSFGIVGDADGNGDPGTTDPWLANSGGADVPDLSLSESIVLIIDVDEDGTPDAAVGVKPGETLTVDGIKIEASQPDLMNPPGTFNGPLSDPLPFISDVSPNPSAGSPDLVFFIRNFQAIPPSSGVNDDEVIHVMAWMGSQDDAGVGEDFAPFFNGFTSILGSIGNTIYCDRDKDGFFGPGDEPLEGVVVDLYDGNGDYVGSRTTSEFGFYVFMDLVGDDYTVELSPSNFAAGGVLEGFFQTVDQSGSPVDGANRASPYSVPLRNGEDHFFADFGIICEQRPPGGEGCTPGFWKQCHHFRYWTNYTPDDLFSEVFGVGPDITLLKAMWRGAGGEVALGRHAVAALLNAAHPEIDYAYTEAEVIALVQQAYASGFFTFIKDGLEEQNELGCDGLKGHDGPKGTDPKSGGMNHTGSKKNTTGRKGRHDDDDDGPKTGGEPTCDDHPKDDDDGGPKKDDDDGGPKKDDDDGGPKKDDDDGGPKKDDNDDGGPKKDDDGPKKDDDGPKKDDDGPKNRDDGPKKDDDGPKKDDDPKGDDGPKGEADSKGDGPKSKGRSAGPRGRRGWFWKDRDDDDE